MSELAAIYVRVSSEMQLDGHSLDAQERICIEWCQDNGYEVYKIYRDEAKSATTTNRPKFQEMLADIAAGRVKVIVVYHTWRLSRSADDIAMIRELEGRGVQIVSASEGGVTGQGASGRFMRNMTLVMGQYQIDQLREATKTGKLERARNGRSNSTYPPFGYTRQFEVVDPERKVIISRDLKNADNDGARLMFELYATGQHSDLDVAKELNRRGYLTSGAWGKRPFGKDTVRAMLINPFYAGWVGYRGMSNELNSQGKTKHNSKRAWTWMKGEHEPTISQELFDQCQQVRLQRGRKYTGRRPSAEHVYLLQRIARCSHCGGKMRSTRWGQDGIAYRCTAKERGEKCSAKHSHVPEDALIPDLDALIAKLHLPDRIIDAAKAQMSKDDAQVKAQKARAKLEAEKGRLAKMYQAGGIDDDYYTRELNRIKGELSEIVVPEQADITKAAKLLNSLVTMWGRATLHEKRDILAALLKWAEIDPDTRKITHFEAKQVFTSLFDSIRLS